MFGDFQQADIAFCACFLTVGLNPQMTIKGNLKIVFRQIRHIRPTQARECAEDE